jgi:glycosyltransferase 2 family protein
MADQHPRRRYWLVVVVLLVLLYLIVPQLGSFRSSSQLLRHPSPVWLLAALLATATTYLSAATTYWLLAFKPLRYPRTVLVQLAAMFVNRLLPAGIGGLGANYAYLRRTHHDRAQAASVVAMNNTLGIVGHVLLISLSLLLLPGASHDLRWSGTTNLLHWLLGAAVIIALVGLWGRHRITGLLSGIGADLWEYRRRRLRLAAALACQLALTLGNVLGLAACCEAFGVHLRFVTILLIFTLGAGAGTAVPSPGGLGSFEAGLTTGLIASRVASPTALAVALLYRLASYWLPLLPGGIALLVAQRRQYFGKP